MLAVSTCAVRWNRATSSKPFKCQEAGCEKSFTANNSLQNHMRKHTGEQPYACPYDDCSERFTLKTGLQTHLKLHEALNGERAICLHAACRKSFKTNAELRTHMYISCPGLVEECAALRSALAHTIREFDSAEVRLFPRRVMCTALKWLCRCLTSRSRCWARRCNGARCC